MRAQEIFDISAKHLLTQNDRAEDDYQCLYRTPDGMKCAIGCLITDRMYHIDMEGGGIEDLMEDYPAFKRKFRLKNIPLLNELQKCHDTEFVQRWRIELSKIAKQFNLDPGVLKMVVK